MDSDLRPVIRALKTLSPEEKTALFQEMDWVLLPRNWIAELKQQLLTETGSLSPLYHICLFCDSRPFMADDVPERVDDPRPLFLKTPQSSKYIRRHRPECGGIIFLQRLQSLGL